MKILCHSCGAKYAIADEKVRGRRVKVRCKSCRTAIVVDGLAMDADAEAAEYEQHGGTGEEDEATRVHAGAMGGEEPPSDAWSVNLSDTDQRTMTTDEIVAGWQSGLITNDAYVWREGMDDWMGVGEVPDLANLIAQSVAPAASPAPVAGSSPWGASAPDASAGFGFGNAPAAARVASPRAQAHDLFGSAAAAGSEEEAIAQAHATPGASDYADARMTGARNENSVLFSLDALKAGFGDAGHAKPARPAPNKPSSGESANLDDLMSIGGSGPSNALFGLAQNQALLTAPAPPPPPPPPPVPAFPSDPALGAAASIAPSAGGKNKMVFILGGAVVLLLLVVVGLSVAFMGGKGDDEKLAKAETGEKKSDDEKSGKSGASDEKKDEKKDDGAEEKKDEASDTKPAESAAAAGEKKEPTEEEKKRFAEAMKKKEEEAKTAPKEEAKKEEVAKKENPSTGVASFNKGAAIAALSVAASQASGCKRPGGPTGSGKAIVTFAPSGRVTSANVTGGSFGGTPVGGCIAGVFRRANVPAFSGDPVTVSKSFTIPD